MAKRCAQRAVVMAEADIGVMFTPSPHPSMQANASTAGGTPNAAGSGIAAPSSATTATGFSPICPVAISSTGTSSGTASGGRWAISGATPLAGNAPPTATPMKPGAGQHRGLAAEAWHASQEAAGAPLQRRTPATATARHGARLHRDPAAPTSGTTSVTQVTSEMPQRHTAEFRQRHHRRNKGDDAQMHGPALGGVRPRGGRVWRARAAETRSSSQPSAAIPTDTTNATGSSSRIGAAGTAVETTAVIRLIGFQQFITQNPR